MSTLITYTCTIPLALALASTSAFGQDTRAEVIAQRQAEKAQRLEPNLPTGMEKTLDWLEGRLSTAQWLCGDRPTEADWRLFTTLLRFDAVYHGHFKCNLRRLVDYPALWRYTRRLYAHPAVAPTVDFDHIKRHYYQSHRHINPTGIVPQGPILSFASD